MKHFNKLIVAAIIAAMVLPQITSAADSTPNNFCTKLPQLTIRLKNGLEEQLTKLNKEQKNFVNNIKEDRKEQDTKLAQKRADVAHSREQQYAALRARAKTNAQKQAVETYITTWKNAVNTRNGAIDAAIAAFRTSQDQAITTRHQAVKITATKLKTDVVAALDKAKTECIAKKDPDTVKLEFKLALKNAKNAFKTALAAIPKLRPQFAQFSQTLSQAIKTARQNFRTTMKQAEAILDAAFKKT